jgi:hypothetical protein
MPEHRDTIGKLGGQRNVVLMNSSVMPSSATSCRTRATISAWTMVSSALVASSAMSNLGPAAIAAAIATAASGRRSCAERSAWQRPDPASGRVQAKVYWHKPAAS